MVILSKARNHNMPQQTTSFGRAGLLLSLVLLDAHPCVILLNMIITDSKLTKEMFSNNHCSARFQYVHQRQCWAAQETKSANLNQTSWGFQAILLFMHFYK
jgi:hypothetical protein